jgi:hypothetical protein
MPWSQTPVVSLLLAIAHPRLLPSAQSNASAFSRMAGLSSRTTTLHFSGLNTEPAPLLYPASYSRYRVCTWISLPARWLSFSRVGFPRPGEVTHWVTSTNFIPIYVESQGFGFTLARGWGFFAITESSSTFISEMILNILDAMNPLSR